MVYKQIAIIGAYNIPGRSQVLLTLDRTVRPGEIIEAENKTWKVTSVEVAEYQPHVGLCVVPFTEADAKQVTARDAKSLLDALFLPVIDAPANQGDAANAAEVIMSNPLASMIPPAKQKDHPSVAEQKLKLIHVLSELNTQMIAVRDWALTRLNEFDLGKEPPAVMVLVVSMPRDGMAGYVEQLQEFLMRSMDRLEKEGKLPWANVKAVAGIRQSQ